MKAIMTHQDVAELEKALILASRHVLRHFSDYFMVVVSAFGFVYFATYYSRWIDAVLLIVIYNCFLLGARNVRRG